MIRVGVVYSSSGNGWLGGTNYTRNLLKTLDNEAVGVDLIALVAPSECETLPISRTRIVPTNLFNRRAASRWLRVAAREATGRDVLAERLLHANGLQVFSHSGLLGIRSRLPTINWVPDLQHRRLPGFFEPKLLRVRDKAISRVCRASTLIVASSECAKRDLEEFFPLSSGSVRVLRFVSGSPADVSVVDRSTLERRYQFKGPYFFVPNQFWAHKNHGVVIDALRILRSRGQHVQVLATGSTADYRRPRYFEELMERRAAAGVESTFMCLGVVPYEDVVNLARGAVALINPSLFEGWSTSVEEAKTLGKAVLLSDIDVHREQAPQRGSYFPPNDPESLAGLMWQLYQQHDPVHEATAAESARRLLPGRRRAFAESYAAIVREALARGKRS